MVYKSKDRQLKEIWQMTRKKIIKHEQSTRLRYKAKINESSAQLDQIITRKLGTHKSENLRTLRGRCHLLGNVPRHRRMMVEALKNGVLCPDWRAELSKE
jgi:5-methylcytosine-specific restriction endonuclease McrA